MSDRTTWDEKAHLDLLMAVLNNISLTKEEWDKALVELRAKGYSYTPSAAIIKLLSSPQTTIQLQLLRSKFPTSNIVIMETPTKGAPFKWDAEAERDLFAACLVAAGEPKGPTLKKAMEIMNDNFGERFTQKAATHRFQHLQKLKRKDGTAGNGSGEATPKKARTPKKRGKADDADADTDNTPKPKKRRSAATKKATALETQDDEEETGSVVKNENDAKREASTIRHIHGFDDTSDSLDMAAFGG
ncbi:hypothetical protein VMCG_04423 [Cytospora schulzeri]|uniref:Uncharacterized protein n=1 Tax=Cytospora schulzeri TaxID=448051 RepID=A0A423WSH7_9PEZI|nr:hypothetical protein VMCG_04423 [Valsa malicola]